MLFVPLVTKAGIKSKYDSGVPRQAPEGLKRLQMLRNVIATYTLTFYPWQLYPSRLASEQQETLKRLKQKRPSCPVIYTEHS